MNTTHNGKEYTLTEGEGGKLTLTPLSKPEDTRTPEAGDVWAYSSEGIAILSSDGGNTQLVSEFSEVGRRGSWEASAT